MATASSPTPPLDTNLPSRCPRCGGELEQGYVLANGALLSWAKEIGGPFSTKAQVLDRGLLRVPRRPGVKCAVCRLITISYDPAEPSPYIFDRKP